MPLTLRNSPRCGNACSVASRSGGHPAALVRAATACLGARAAVVHRMLAAFLCAQAADLGAERAGLFRALASPRHEPGGHAAGCGAIHVEGDASSASYFLAAGVIAGGPVRVIGVGRDSIQGDVRFADVLERMGAHVTMGEDWVECTGTLPLHALDMDLNHIPDAAMTAAVLALFAEGPSTLRNIGSWRVKETDRLAAMTIELRRLGADVEEGADFLRITPRVLRPDVAIDTYDDHRIAMSFSLVSLGGVPVRINDPQCVGKTFPEYFEIFSSIVQ